MCLILMPSLGSKNRIFSNTFVPKNSSGPEWRTEVWSKMRVGSVVVSLCAENKIRRKLAGPTYTDCNSIVGRPTNS